MTSHNILQPVDVNSRDMDRSPARKRARYESPVKSRWSLNRNDVILDEVYDCGVSLLDSGSEDENVQLATGIDISSPNNSSEKKEQIAVLESTLSKECLKKISLGEWQGFIVQQAELNNTASTINYFNHLSDEVILHIFHFLPKRILSHAALVCRRWHCLTLDESLWARMDVSCKNLQPGAIGHILSRQVVILRLASSEIAHPPLLPGCRAFIPEFKARLLYLDLSMAHLSCETLIDIFDKCRRLKKLSLEHVTVNSDVMKMLAQSRELEVLNLSMIEGLDLEGLKCLLTCEKLRELNLAWTRLTIATINYLCSNLPESLDRLNIAGCRKLLTDRNVLGIVSCCGGLRELDLSDCTGVTGEAVHHITLLDDLNFLSLSRCYQIPYKALLELKKIDSLMYLDVHGGYIDTAELRVIQDALGSRVNINKFKFSSVARPTVGPRHSSIWNLRVRD